MYLNITVFMFIGQCFIIIIPKNSYWFRINIQFHSHYYFIIFMRFKLLQKYLENS